MCVLIHTYIVYYLEEYRRVSLISASYLKAGRVLKYPRDKHLIDSPCSQSIVFGHSRVEWTDPLTQVVMFSWLCCHVKCPFRSRRLVSDESRRKRSERNDA
jgi:hypothetical protein